MSTKKKSYFLSQPHQPFFTLAILSAIVMMGVFFANYRGLWMMENNPITFHAYSFIFTVFTPFFMGFLLTTYPRFSQNPAIEKKEYLRILFLLSLGVFLLLFSTVIPSPLIQLSSIMILLSQLYTAWIFTKLYTKSPLADKHDLFWILLSWGFGILANLLFLLHFLGVFQESILAVHIGIFLYLLMMALSVAQRMVPFFSHIMIERHPHLLRNILALMLLYTVSKSFSFSLSALFLLIAGALLTQEILRWNLPFKKADPVLWILHLAIFWLPTALIIGGFSELASWIWGTSYMAVTIHLVALGFLTTIMIGFGTRVTLGHSGNMMQIDTYTKVLFYLTQALVYFRAFYAYTGSMPFFDISAILWIGLFIAWAWKYLPTLISGKKLS
jgi:uncharacterized protein involved in response to NO